MTVQLIGSNSVNVTVQLIGSNILNAIRLVQLADLNSELSVRSGKAINLKELSTSLDNIPLLRAWCVEKIRSKKLLRDFKVVLNDAYLESQNAYKALGIS